MLALLLAACTEPTAGERMARARQFLEHGHPSGAVVELKRLLQERPGDAEARLMLAGAYVELGNLGSAEKELNRALELGADRGVIAIKTAQLWLQEGAYQKIVEQLQIPDDWPSERRVAALSLRGNARLARHELAAANRDFEAALALAPNDVDALVGLAATAAQMSDPAAARTALDRALRVAPHHPYLLGLAGRTAFQSGDYAQASRVYRAQIEAAPDSISARLALAEALLAQGEDASALTALAVVLERAPRHPGALYLRAILDLRRGDLAAAHGDSLDVLAVWPDHEPSLLLAATAESGLGLWKEARWHLETLLRRDPNHAGAQALMSQVAAAQANLLAKPAAPPGAGRPLAEDLALFELTPEMLSTSQTALLNEPGSLAEEVFTHIALTATEMPEADAARLLALALFRSGEEMRGRRLLEQRLRDEPADLVARRVLSQLYLRSADFDDAVPQLRALVAANPGDATALNNLAWALLQRGDAQEAKVVAERAIALAPDDPRVMDTFGLTLLQAGDTARAAAILQRAAADTDGSAEVRLHAAQALLRDGRTDDGRRLLQEILSTPTDAEAHHAAAALLRTLGE